jgi:hypothetical protein
MKTYQVYFFSENTGSDDNQKIQAETYEDAFNKFLIGKQPNKYKSVVVDSNSFLDSFATPAKSFLNPLYISDDVESKSLANTTASVEKYYLQKSPESLIKDGPFSNIDLKSALNNQQIGDQWRVFWGDSSWMLAKDFLHIRHNYLFKKLSESKNDQNIENVNFDLNLDLLNSEHSIKNSESKISGPKQYKVMTQKDKWFSQKFDPEKLEQALNAYAKEGWVVKSICTAQIAGLGGAREELIVVFEK